MRIIFLIKLLILSSLISCSEHSKSTKELKAIDLDTVKTSSSICEEKIATAKQEPSVGLMSEADASNRLKLLYNAKAAPIYFISEPKLTDPSEFKRPLEKAYNRMSSVKNPWGFIMKNKSVLQSNAPLSRKLFLREGYLYSPEVVRANTLSQLVDADTLFSESTFWIQRGSAIMQVHRDGNYYYFSDGPYKGRVVTINFMDRLTLDKPAAPLHIDFVPSKDKYKYHKIKPIHISEKHVIADVTYLTEPGITVETLFERNESSVDMVCEKLNMSKYRESIAVREGGIRNLKRVMLEQVAERVPFDEPKHEVDQEDGNLRNAWTWAFSVGKLGYQYKNARMVEANRVYGHLGEALPPQVCVDFLVDTMDRAAGTWYSDVHERNHPVRTVGAFDSTSFTYKNSDGEDKKYALRTVDGLTQFASDNPKWFEIINIPQIEQLPIGSKNFWEYMPGLNLMPGDMVFIRGNVPWDTKQHSHSFYIYDTDPITGIPLLLAGNAGPASLRPWAIETNRTPLRKIVTIIRFKDEFLALLSKGRSASPIELVIK